MLNAETYNMPVRQRAVRFLTFYRHNLSLSICITFSLKMQKRIKNNYKFIRTLFLLKH